MNPQQVNNVLTEAVQDSTPAVTVAEAWLLFSEEQVQVLGLAEHQPPHPRNWYECREKLAPGCPYPGNWSRCRDWPDLCRSHLRTWTLRKKKGLIVSVRLIFYKTVNIAKLPPCSQETITN